MGTITAQEILDRAKILLVDAGNDRWIESESLGWLNEGLLEIVRFIPTAYTVNEAVQLSSGVKQTIPTGRIEFLGATMNMGGDGSTPGDVINFIDMKELGYVDPTWASQTQSATTEFITKKEGDRKTYYVSPPSDGTGYIEIVCSDTPAEISVGTAIPIDDIYSPIILDYVMFRCLSVDSTEPHYRDMAQLYFKKFTESISAKVSVEQGADLAAGVR